VGPFAFLLDWTSRHGQSLAALSAPALQHRASAARLHAAQEAMHLGASSLLGLISSFGHSGPRIHQILRRVNVTKMAAARTPPISAHSP
jgi:hypothetical protein